MRRNARRPIQVNSKPQQGRSEHSPSNGSLGRVIGWTCTYAGPKGGHKVYGKAVLLGDERLCRDCYDAYGHPTHHDMKSTRPQKPTVVFPDPAPAPQPAAPVQEREQQPSSVLANMMMLTVPQFDGDFLVIAHIQDQGSLAMLGARRGDPMPYLFVRLANGTFVHFFKFFGGYTPALDVSYKKFQRLIKPYERKL